jgi:hypothetical protein
MFTDRQFRLARQWSNDQLKTIAPLMGGDVINVSGWKDEDKHGGLYRDYFSKASSYRISNYGGFRGFQNKDGEIALDLTEELHADLAGAFDVVYNHTTLEHIFEVRTAFKNLCLMSRDLVVIVVPFAQVQHEYENILDFWRFTPTCLRHLLKESGLEVLYESANTHYNAATYILMVGSKKPQNWRGVLPQFKPLSEVANGIGLTLLKRLKRFIKRA